MSKPRARRVLGLSAFYHDSAATLVVDGEVVAAAQEERFTRVKHDSAFPKNAVEYCLREASISADQLDFVAFYDKPLRHFDRLLETYLAVAPRGFSSFRQAVPVWLKKKLWLPREIRKGLCGKYTRALVFPEHHQSHAASAFFPSPYERAAIVTCDGVGEWATTTIGLGEGNRIELKKSLSFPHSLGLLYSAFTYFCGFKVNSGEYKLMGLAPYGQPVYADLIREKLVDIKPDGSFRLNMDYFTYCEGLTMTGGAFARLFGGPARHAESDITDREMNLAASIQVVTEELMGLIVRHAHDLTKASALCLAGGVALNCVANGKVQREGPFKDIWIQPAAGDAGGSLGAALFVWHQLLGGAREGTPTDRQKGSLLGPRYDNDAIGKAIESAGVRGTRIDDEQSLVDRVAASMADGKVVGWFHGRMEFGPRALGARSIIGDARNTQMQSVMNLKIKYRESFRPFAPCVLQERANDYFELGDGVESPYMLLVANVRDKHRLPLTDDQRATLGDKDLRKRVNIPRSSVPAITHVDYSARIQTVDERRHGRFYRLMKAFERATGCPVIVNTSFNVRGEPIVNRPSEAINCFLNTEMDVLVLENWVLTKDDQPDHVAKRDRSKYLAQFSLD